MPPNEALHEDIALEKKVKPEDRPSLPSWEEKCQTIENRGAYPTCVEVSSMLLVSQRVFQTWGGKVLSHFRSANLSDVNATSVSRSVMRSTCGVTQWRFSELLLL